jgi:hypothetical protein
LPFGNGGIVSLRSVSGRNLAFDRHRVAVHVDDEALEHSGDLNRRHGESDGLAAGAGCRERPSSLALDGHGPFLPRVDPIESSPHATVCGLRRTSPVLQVGTLLYGAPPQGAARATC